MAKRIIPDHLVAYWLGSEATYGAGPAAAPAASEAIRHISSDAPLPVARDVRDASQTGHRGSSPSFAGSVDPLVIRLLLPIHGPGAPVSGPPSMHALFLAAAFEGSLGGGAYTYERSLATAVSAWLWAATSDGTFGAAYTGIGSPEFGFPEAGTDQARIEFQLQAAKGAIVYATTLGAQALIGATSITLPEGHGWVIAGAPAWIQVGDGIDSEVMKVTAVSGNVATVVRAQAGSDASAWDLGDEVTAYFPDRTAPAVPPIGELGGGFQLTDGGGTKARQFTKASVVVRTGVDLDEKPALEAYRDGLVLSKYGDDAAQLTADMTYTVGSDGVVFLHRAQHLKSSLAIQMTLGSTTGNRVKIAFPEAQVSSLAAPDTGDGPRRGTAIFNGYSDDGSDVVITFD